MCRQIKSFNSSCPEEIFWKQRKVRPRRLWSQTWALFVQKGWEMDTDLAFQAFQILSHEHFSHFWAQKIIFVVWKIVWGQIRPYSFSYLKEIFWIQRKVRPRRLWSQTFAPFLAKWGIGPWFSFSKFSTMSFFHTCELQKWFSWFENWCVGRSSPILVPTQRKFS